MSTHCVFTRCFAWPQLRCFAWPLVMCRRWWCLLPDGMLLDCVDIKMYRKCHKTASDMTQSRRQSLNQSSVFFLALKPCLSAWPSREKWATTIEYVQTSWILRLSWTRGQAKVFIKVKAYVFELVGTAWSMHLTHKWECLERRCRRTGQTLY